MGSQLKFSGIRLKMVKQRFRNVLSNISNVLLASKLCIFKNILKSFQKKRLSTLKWKNWYSERDRKVFRNALENTEF